MIYNIHHLHCGTMCPICAPIYGQKGLHAKMVCHCLLVETDKGLVLIDTGFGTQDYLHPQTRLGRLFSKMSAIQFDFTLTAVAQIQQLGFQPSDVKHILVSHLDLDHAGGISDFPQATIHILSSEYNAAQKLSMMNKLRYRPQQFKNHRHWNFLEPKNGESWFNFQKVQGFHMFNDEILLIPLLGHTTGHCGIAIKQHNGWVFFCGDAYYSHLELDPNHKLPLLDKLERLFAENNTARLKTLSEIQRLAQNEPRIEIICAHDPVELDRYLVK
ncbi:MBL fold metallo-hydrolase [Acinetobacter bereziniae]|uniref:MBL fold metallo-hydrolase n=1 Tax=Acinetobacter bereziniae TaxID=106648 RepID=UPI00125035C0|nr:MBL fold metallo-hydrolase [Acinetobacter bereziniae]MDR6543416.1 glyoxylase-like metal-dependent hydrolase (beta-lactamase superfamily II) [Acinetobacter bereziniae]